MDLYLISSDRPLCAAIAEQIELAAPGELRLHESENWPVSFFAEPKVLMIDTPLVDEKLLGHLQAMCAGGKKPVTLILGDLQDERTKILPDTNLVTESFAKPLRLGHLLTRLQFHLQSHRTQNGSLSFGNYRLEPALRQVTVEPAGTLIHLTEKETHLLEYLGRSDKPVPREELLAAIWGYDGRIDTHTLETHIYRLRRKLDPDGKTPDILTMRQGAYQLAVRSE